LLELSGGCAETLDGQLDREPGSQPPRAPEAGISASF